MASHSHLSEHLFKKGDVTMYELIKACNCQSSLTSVLKDTISSLCKYLDFDGWSIIIFSKDKLHGFVMLSSENGQGFASAGLGKLYFDGLSQKSFLNLLLDEKQVVLYRRKNDIVSKYSPISEDVAAELYYPLFSIFNFETEVAGCLYLLKTDCPGNGIYDLLANESFIQEINDIQWLFGAVHNKHLEDSRFLNLIHIFSEIIKTKDPYIASHSYNVAFLSNLVGRGLGFSANQLYRLYIASLLHDIGKIYIPRTVLNKRKPLTDAEKNEIKMHPKHSYNIIRDLAHGLSDLTGIEDIVLQHHERYDGTGYPLGLEGEEILTEARILAVADAVDAMLSMRSYKKPKTIKDCINELIDNMGEQFDPEIAQLMVGILMKKQTYQEVILREPMIMGTVELLTKEKSCQLQGTLIKTDLGHYRFKLDRNECLCEKCPTKLPNIISATFHTESNGEIYEYEAAIKYKDRGKIHISELTPKPSCSYFILQWALRGTILLKNSKSADAIINKIGGDCLGFYLDKNKFYNDNIQNGANAVMVYFEDGSIIKVTGKVVKSIKICQRLYCEFKYINILEGTRDKIFRQIFQKQTGINRGVFAAMVGK